MLKKIKVVILTSLFSFLALGCSHKFDVTLKPDSPKLKELQEKDKERAERNKQLAKEIEKKNKIPEGIRIETNDRLQNHVTIMNDTNEDIFIEYSRSYMIVDGRSYRVVAGEQRKINSALNSPDHIIAGGTRSDLSFYAPEREISSVFSELGISYNFRGERRKMIINWVPFSYNDDDPKYLGEVEYVEPLEKALCYFTGIFYGGYCWVIANTEASESEIGEAKKIASKRFRINEDEIELQQK